MRGSKFGASRLFVTAFMMFLPLINAATIYNDLSGTSTPGGYVVGQYSPGNSYVIGAAFTPSQAYIFGQFQGLLSFSAGVNHMIIELHEDSGGVPGLLLESWDLISVLGSAPAIITLTSVRNPALLARHQYWITAGMASPTSVGVWWITDIGGLCCGAPGEVQGIATSSLNGGPFTPGSLTTVGFHAFAVTGVATSSCPVSVTLSLGGRETSMSATFRPASGFTLAAAASACGFAGFNWQQTITNLPCPSPFYPNNSSLLPVPDFCSNASLTAAIPFDDPPSGGYTYLTAGYNPFPFYYPSSLALVEELQFPDTFCVYSSSGVCIIPLVSSDDRTLAFYDAPANPCLPGGTYLNQLDYCGGTSDRPFTFMAFTTALVGIYQDGTPSPPLYRWSWTDTYNGTSGGIATTYNNLPVDPGSGTGGITITSIDDSTLPPVVPSSQIATTASGLAYSRISQTFDGTVTVTNISNGAISGPLQILFTGLPSNVSLENATSSFSGTPYLTVSAVTSLAPGQSVTVSVQFKNPSNATISFTPAIYSGNIN